MEFSEIIKAVVIDIDGCLTSKVFGQPLNLDLLQQIQELSKNAGHDPAIPFLVLNTGRDINHTELMARVLDAFHYFIIEMGAAVVSIHGAEFIIKTDPQINSDSLAYLHALQNDFLNKFPQYQQYLQFGKRFMFTFLFENEDPIKDECANDLQQFIQEQGYSFSVDIGHNFLNIIFPDINKGTGMDLLFNVDPDLNSLNVAGIGDSTGDWDFLKMCAFSTCPSNGSDFLKENCHFTSSYPEVEGTLEILEFIIKRNRALLKRLKAEQKQPKSLIKSVIIDINGTIDTAIYGKPTDLEKIKKIRHLIEQAKKDPAIPNIILNTGWDISYTALYAQILNDFQYHIIERGAAIISIDGPQIHIHINPIITQEKIEQIGQFQTGFIATYPHYNRFLQVGKKYMLSFQFEMEALEKDDCLADLRTYSSDNNLEFEIEEGPNFINISIPGINKGSGARFLLDIDPELHFENIVGIGDSDGDWDYIQLCGFKACPSNASEFLKKNCDYIANKPETQGTLEILEQIIQWNLEILLNDK